MGLVQPAQPDLRRTGRGEGKLPAGGVRLTNEVGVEDAQADAEEDQAAEDLHALAELFAQLTANGQSKGRQGDGDHRDDGGGGPNADLDHGHAQADGHGVDAGCDT